MQDNLVYIVNLVYVTLCWNILQALYEFLLDFTEYPIYKLQNLYLISTYVSPNRTCIRTNLKVLSLLKGGRDRNLYGFRKAASG